MTAGGVQASHEQTMAALAYGNQIRLERARVRREIRAGRIPVIDVLMDPPAECANMSLLALLTAQNRWGDIRARKCLQPLIINELRPLRALTERQRNAIADRLRHVNGSASNGR